ncbi:uncharacterized protein LOC124419898 [Lucilia cuprina]|uniref:uncharacterized protein LOC124419898 n=1 Tax=Lucilia cuprina TaxID=7375 RepID=UPI001F062727|nr:uncharacterized protein LOC124419898 [Lucilia cuprina]
MNLHTSWENFKTNLSKIDNIEVPRHVLTSSHSTSEIHGFADASMRAYGCCIYVRSRVANQITCRLLTAKSKVAPLKTKSLPRLELCAAHLLAKLWAKVRTLLSCNIKSVTFWTDSEITLHWIKTHPSTLATFVSNRVADIQELSDQIVWRHVPSRDNPADIVSRGCNVDDLNDSIWFKGPEFLLSESNEWPENQHFTLNDQQMSLEKRKTNVFFAVKDSNSIIELINKHSSYLKLIRVFSYVLRFIQRCRKKELDISTVTPTANEMNWSFLKIVEIIQNDDYSQEIKKLQNSQVLQSNLQKLNPFIHEFNDHNRTFSLIRLED